MSDKYETSFPVDETTHATVNFVVQNSDRFNSAKEFYERAIESNVWKIRSETSGGYQGRELIRQLSRVRGIEVEPPSDESRACLVEGVNFDTPRRVELSPDTEEPLSNVKMDTGMSKSQIMRRCVFLLLYNICQKSGLITDWRKTDIEATWKELSDGFERPRLKCHSVLQLYFGDHRPRTINKLNADPYGRDRFANEYVNNFHGNECYEFLVEKRGDRVFTTVENVVNEHSDYTVGVEDEASDFLEGILEK